MMHVFRVVMLGAVIYVLVCLVAYALSGRGIWLGRARNGLMVVVGGGFLFFALLIAGNKLHW